MKTDEIKMKFYFYCCAAIEYAWCCEHRSTTKNTNSLKYRKRHESKENRPRRFSSFILNQAITHDHSFDASDGRVSLIVNAEYDISQ